MSAVNLEFTHERALLTIEVLVENLVIPEVDNKVLGGADTIEMDASDSDDDVMEIENLENPNEF